MGRSGYTEDGDMEHWDLIRWRGQVASAIRGKRGQAFLRELIESLDALPDKRLIANELIQDGEVCALGSVGLKRGVEMNDLDVHDYDGLAKIFGVAHQLIREIEWENDEGSWGACAPERRWQRMREWAVKHLIEWES